EAPVATPARSEAPLKGGALAVGTVALSLATFMNVLDTSIANVSLPAIAGDLAVSPNQATWVITSFAVANAVSVPLTGWLTQRFGQVRLFMASVLLFVSASLLCGLAPSFGLLILFRILQGAVAGPMIPLSQTLLLASYPRQKAGLALGMWSITTLVAPVAGPLLGGWITDNISWPWIFYINVPVGLVAAAFTWGIYQARESPRRKLPVDRIGLALLVVWVGSLQIMLDKGKDLDWFGSTEIVILAVMALVGFILFMVWELTEAHPVVDLTFFTRRNFWTGTLSLSFAYAAFFGNVVLLPLWLQQHLGYTSTLAGMALAPVGVLAILLTPLVGRNAHKFDPRVLATISFFIFALVLWMRGGFNAQADFWTIMVPTIVQGAAVAFFFIPLLALTLSGLRPDQVAAASGLVNFARISAGAFGTSIATTWWSNRASLHHAQLAEHITEFSPSATQALSALQANGFTPEQSYAMLSRLIDQQAYTMAATDIFRLSALLFLLLIPMIWMARPTRGGALAGAAAH
ncbi:MAG TPA: DHA2 family efflux MFS transporter permease subunit, partial [Burkholderiales bacterium]|nr:DHA2 family efflux MFS transporter permease subunit [Burkholderiales bacterium]